MFYDTPIANKAADILNNDQNENDDELMDTVDTPASVPEPENPVGEGEGDSVTNITGGKKRKRTKKTKKNKKTKKSKKTKKTKKTRKSRK